MNRRTLMLLAAVGVLAGACADMSPPRVLSRRCADVRFPIYFEQGSDRLTAPAQAVISANARRLGACRVGAAEVLGLADADGGAAANLELSQRRAAVVAQALAAAGLPAPSFDIQGLGSQGAVTPSGRTAPLHRRAEVVLHAAPAA